MGWLSIRKVSILYKYMYIREHGSDSLFRDDHAFLDFGGFQGSETPIQHAQNLKLITELNSICSEVAQPHISQ